MRLRLLIDNKLGKRGTVVTVEADDAALDLVLAGQAEFVVVRDEEKERR